jgi:hypothetical protein
MRIAILAAIVLIFAGTAHGQLLGGSINTGGSSLNHSTTLNTNVSTSTTSGSAPAVSDVVVNRNSNNPGEFVPSTFSTYQDVLAEAKLQAALRPQTVAEAARQEQERRSKSKDANVIQLDEDAHGKLMIAEAKK